MIESMDAQRQQLTETSDRLRSLLAAQGGPRDDAWNRKVTRALADFETQFRGYVQAKNRGGFLHPVLEQRPTQGPAVDRLGFRNEQVMNRLHRLRKTAHATQTNPERTSAHQPDRLHRLLDEVCRIEEEENELVLRVFCTEIGYPASC